MGGLPKRMRTLLYVPGNKKSMIQKALSYGPDIVVLDLEDSVPMGEKSVARALVAEAVASGQVGPVPIVVRINGLGTAESILDLRAIVLPGVVGIRVPKVESAAEIRELDNLLTDLEEERGLGKGTIRLLPILESPRGVLRSYEIAAASARVAALTLGAEDLTAALGVERSREGSELQHARGHIVLCAAAAGVPAIDTVFPHIQDEDGLVAETRAVKRMGFSGKSVIHPRQIEPVHRVFAPTPEDVENARRIVEAFERSQVIGDGAVAVGGRMVDLPVVARARRVLALAGAEAEGQA